MKTMERIGNKCVRLGKAARKYLHQRAHPAVEEAKPIFVVGCQRSGTNMLQDVFERSSETWNYHEAGRNRAFENWRIRPLETLDRLLRGHRARFVVFRPILDSQLVDKLLTVRPTAKAIWLYRHYADVAASAVKKWGSHQKELLGKAVTQPANPDWWAEGLRPETIELLKPLYNPDMSDLAAATLFWFWRNQIFFDLGLERRPDVLLVKYEDLVLKPAETFPRVFGWLDIRYEPALIEKVFSTSAGRHKDIVLPAAVRNLCDGLLARLDGLQS